MRSEDKPVAAQIIRLMLEAAKIQTMQGIYKRVRPGDDSRIRTKLSAVGTETGRLSSSEDRWWPEPTTNLQNLPKKTANANPLYDVRRCVIPPPGHVLLEADLSQAEALVTAAYAGDKAKIERMLDPEGDEHRLLASKIFDCAPADVNPKTQRPLGKMGNHALNYGAGWKTFMENVNKDADTTGIAISAALAKKIIAAWKELNWRTVNWWTEVADTVAEDGCLINPFGRKRIFLGGNPRGRDVLAFLPQSTIADLLNMALVEVHAAEDADFRVVHQIHDAILVEAKITKWYAVAKLMKRLMERPLEINGIKLTIPVDVSRGKKNWAEMEEVRV